MRTLNQIVMLWVLFLTATGMEAKVRFPSVISSGMVLQQQTEVKLWGKARANSTIKVSTSWNGKTYRTTSDGEGCWDVKVITPKAGLTSYKIIVSDGEQTVLDNVLIGEVWLCSGQSNMEMPMRGFDRQPLQGTNDIIARAKPSVPIRMFLTDSKDGTWIRQFSKTPLDDMKGEWLDNTPDNVAVTSATAYYFARYLNDVLEVPVGIIVSTLGGSRIEPWMSREALAAFPDKDLSFLDNDLEVKNIHSNPCVLFNAKIAPLIPFSIRGFLWYQGESNRDNAVQYADLMSALVADWRGRWAKDLNISGDSLPFYYVEIAPFNYESPQGMSAAVMREAQAYCMKTIPNSGMASTIDIGNPVFIHPMDKATVGQRLAWLALAKTYGKTGFGYASPVYKSMEVKEGKIYINVDNAAQGLCPMWTSLKGFEIAGDDRVFHPTFAEIETKSCRLAVSSKDVPNPVAVRYAYRNMPEVSVYNIHGLPLLPFRTDNW